LAYLLFKLYGVLNWIIERVWGRLTVPREFLELFKDAGDVSPEDMGVKGYKPYYYKRDVDGLVEDALSSGRSVIIAGRRKAGKTRMLYEALRKLKGYRVVKIRRDKIPELSDMPPFPERSKKILVLDDVELYLNADLHGLVGKLGGRRKVVVAATCRTESLQEVIVRFPDLLEEMGFTLIEIPELTREEAEKVAEEAGIRIEWGKFDGTIGSLMENFS